jgi:general secretion pathway protein D
MKPTDEALPGRRLRTVAGILAAIALVALLGGCAASRAYQQGRALLAEGKTREGLARIEEAIRLDPMNAEYRIAHASRLASVINQLVLRGENARREGRLGEAEQAYHELQALDPANQMARQGLDAVIAARRHQLALNEAEDLLKKGDQASLNVASEKLRTVLAENPRHSAALNLKTRLDQARSKEARPDAKLAAAFRQPISLEFRDAPLRTILEVVSKVSNLNFYYDKEIRPDLKATIFARETSIEDAVRLLLVTNQLEYKVLNQNSILIYPATPAKLKEYQTLAVRSFYLTNADVKAVSNSIKTLLKTKDIVTDERLGIIMVRDTPEAVRMAERIVALQDLADSEVMLEVEIMEVKRSRLMELGIQWPTQLTLSPLQSGTTGLSLDALRNLDSSSIQASIGNVTANVRKEDQYGNILANPRIRVRNKDKAKVQIGDRVPVITTTSTSTGFVSESVSYVDVGLKLEVEPNIYLDNEVAIKINLEVSNLVREILSRSGTLAYQIGSRGASTTLRLKDGETQILAGLISDEDRSNANKVPLMGDLPIAGRLFGSQKDDSQRTEILLSITPHVVRSIARPQMLDAEFESGTESAVGAEALRLAPEQPSSDARAPGETKPAATPGGGAPAPAAATPAAGSPGLTWQGPSQVRVGEQFSVVLQLSSQQALSGMAALAGFDPKVFQDVQVQEGDFFKQGRGKTSFSQRVDPAQGRVFVAAVRQGEAGSDPGTNGSGALVTLSMKAVKAAPSATLQLLSATPEPAGAAQLALPAAHAVRVLP